MFTITFIRRELRRRLGRTLLTVLGLAVGVGLVAGITSIARGLDRAQGEVLDPLSSVGTDLMVTRPVEFRSGGGPRGLEAPDARALAEENTTVLTDLSKLGKPGEKFERDSFMPGTQLTFPEGEAERVATLDGVASVARGLVLTGVHQTGTVPNQSVEIETGGDTITIERAIPPMTQAERKAADECMRQAQQKGGPGDCMPKRFREFRGTITTPRERIRRFVEPPNTDIESDTYSIGGVDLSVKGVGLITPAQITSGRFLSRKNDAVLSEAYAKRKGIKLGGTLTINDRTLKVVGLAKPPLGGQAADVYVPLTTLQDLADRKGRVNVLLVRADDASSVSSLGDKVEQTVDGATVSSAEDVAAKVTGSLVDAAALSDRVGLILSVALLLASFLLATLLTLSSVAKRIREIGTLKAIGWRKGVIVRQIVGESLTQGILGGIVGVALGVVAALAIAAAIPPLQAMAGAAEALPGPFGLGQMSGSETIQVRALIDATTIGIAFGLALLGGLIAGAAGALRAARLSPADALRQVG